MKISRRRSLSPNMWTVADMGTFYGAHRSELFSHANRVLKDSRRAEEVLQEAVVKVLLAAPELTSTDHALAYMHRTIENLCMDIFRAEGRRPNLVLIDEVDSDLNRIASENRDLADLISAADDAVIVRQALSLLSSAERQALVMKEIEGRTTAEIAQELGVKESSVRHTLSRARSSLRKVLSEFILDEKRGLTALDLLSVSYKKAASTTKKASKIALSIVLLAFAFLGFNNFSGQSKITSFDQKESSKSGEVIVAKTNNNTFIASMNYGAKNDAKPETTGSKENNMSNVNAKATPLNFYGLDSKGIPTGFTITDNKNTMGSLYLRQKEATLTEVDKTLESIAKTESKGPNVLLNQTLREGFEGISYETYLSVGIKGNWIPASVKVISVDSERLLTGNYMVSVVIQVKSLIETTVVIPTPIGGRDLDLPPSRIVTRIVLNPDKTQILAQAVQVVERSIK